jgi:hypothetical protein
MKLIHVVRGNSIVAATILTIFFGLNNPVLSQQRACVVTDEGAIVCGKLTTKTRGANSNSAYRREVSKIVYTLKTCKRSDTTVECEFILTNKDQRERYIGISAYDCKIVDTKGKTYKGSSATADGRTESDPRITLVPNIDYAATLTFSGIPEGITQAQLLDVTGYDTGKVQFRNVFLSN